MIAGVPLGAFPVTRRGFLDRCRANAGGLQPAGRDLHDRLDQSGL